MIWQWLERQTIRMETWRFMSEVVSLAVLWVDSKTYRGNLDEFWLLKNAQSAQYFAGRIGWLDT